MVKCVEYSCEFEGVFFLLMEMILGGGYGSLVLVGANGLFYEL
jgi:hypothetical protein